MEPQPLPVEPIVKPQTPWLKVVLFSLAGLTLLGGSFYAGYWYANREPIAPAPKEEVSTPPSSGDSTAPTPLVTKEPTEEWQTYYNETYGYQVEYPRGKSWKVDVTLPYIPPEGTGIEQEIVLAKLTEEGWWLTVFIAVWNNRTSLNLTDWLREHDAPIIQPLSLIPSEPNARIAGEAAVSIFRHRDSRIPTSWYTFFQKGQKVFQIHYLFPTDEEGDFDLYTHILSTFEFEDTKDIPDILPTKPE